YPGRTVATPTTPPGSVEVPATMTDVDWRRRDRAVYTRRPNVHARHIPRLCVHVKILLAVRAGDKHPSLAPSGVPPYDRFLLRHRDSRALIVASRALFTRQALAVRIALTERGNIHLETKQRAMKLGGTAVERPRLRG